MEFLSYTTFTIVAIFVVITGSYWSLTKLGYHQVKVITLLLITGISTPVGARLLHVLTHPAVYQNDPNQIWSLSATGFALLGGLILGCATGLLVAKMLKLPVLTVADHTAPWVGIGIAFMRLGCFVQGCCFGVITHLPWGIRFPVMSPAHVYQLSLPGAKLLDVEPVHPTQLYELGWALVGSGLAAWGLSRKLPNGLTAALFVTVFTVGRWLMLPLRAPDQDFGAFEYFYPILYGGILATSLCFTIVQTRFTNRYSIFTG